MTSLIITLDAEGCRMVGSIQTTPSTTKLEEDTLKVAAVRIIEELQESLKKDGIDSRLIVKDKNP